MRSFRERLLELANEHELLQEQCDRLAADCDDLRARLALVERDSGPSKEDTHWDHRWMDGERPPSRSQSPQGFAEGVPPPHPTSAFSGPSGFPAGPAMMGPNARPPHGAQPMAPCGGRFPGQADAAADDGYSDSGSSSIGSKPDEQGHQRRVRRRRRTTHGSTQRHGHHHHRVVRRRRRHRSRSHRVGEGAAAPIGGPVSSRAAPPKRRASPLRAGLAGVDDVPVPGRFGSGNHQADVDGFINKNVLEARVAHALRTLSEEQQKKVMGTDGGQNSFLLVGRVDNPNGVVMSRIRKVESGG
mmetsp:Transcript_51415/g.95098  ORF Transcript_51415/g.95098 Transcript_51415/m.95098 type:complete len:300 (-) Transcript_51415:105-1004(-)